MKTNYSDTPLVTVQLMCHSEGLKYLSRSFTSVQAQTLDHKQIEVQILFDGTPTEEEAVLVDSLTCNHDFLACGLIATGRHYGYYTVPRNMATPFAWGFYIAHMDVDNEWAPEHLEVLLDAIRTADPELGWPHFTYVRRNYVIDPGAREDLPSGPSPLVLWTKENCERLQKSPQGNFIDTGDFLISRGVMERLRMLTGCMWNSDLRRFGDWDLMYRLSMCAGIRGKAVDAVTHHYHWTGDNLQLTRPLANVAALPEEVYERLKTEGKIRG